MTEKKKKNAHQQTVTSERSSQKAFSQRASEKLAEGTHHMDP